MTAPGHGTNGVHPPVIRAENVSIFYGAREAVKRVTLDVAEHCVTAIIGPSGCGKSTLLRSFNRMNDSIGARVDGRILYHGRDLYGASVDAAEVRRRIGMVFQKPSPFPKSIYENVVWGPRINGTVKGRAAMDELVERSLRGAGLFGEVKDRLHSSALALSGGQQQRLCIARAIANNPEVLLMDEPCSALDPISTVVIEDLIHTLKERYTIVIVTHNLQQAARVSGYTAFLHTGELVEFGPTGPMFSQPKNPRTEDYLTGRYG